MGLPIEFGRGLFQAFSSRPLDRFDQVGNRVQEESLPDGPPIFFGNENRVSVFPGNLDRFVGFPHLTDEGV